MDASRREKSARYVRHYQPQPVKNPHAWCDTRTRTHLSTCTHRYTLNQIAEQLNDPKTEHLFKNPGDVGREFTKGNVRSFLQTVFPPEDDTQAAVELIGSLSIM